MLQHVHPELFLWLLWCAHLCAGSPCHGGVYLRHFVGGTNALKVSIQTTECSEFTVFVLAESSQV
jgi:hypothetical protein